jgi:hypothetical protein
MSDVVKSFKSFIIADNEMEKSINLHVHHVSSSIPASESKLL